MDQILMTAGKIAGIGGLALGVFLLLFRRIELPKASRRHLTLFMWLVWSICVLGIAAFIVGEVLSRDRPDPAVTTAPATYREPVPITLPSQATAFTDFLDRYDGAMVELDCMLDLSVSLREQQAVAEAIGMHEDDFRVGDGTQLPLDQQQSTWIELDLLDGRDLKSSHGGTGIVQYPLRGLFRIGSRAGAGNMMLIYDLREVPEVVSR